MTLPEASSLWNREVQDQEVEGKDGEIIKDLEGETQIAKPLFTLPVHGRNLVLLFHLAMMYTRHKHGMDGYYCSTFILEVEMLPELNEHLCMKSELSKKHTGAYIMTELLYGIIVGSLCKKGLKSERRHRKGRVGSAGGRGGG